MKNNFTTPAFGKVLKAHGIEIDSRYRWNLNASAIRLQVIELNSFNWVTIDQHYSDEIYHDFYSPAYPLTEVLGWLPQYIKNEERHPEWWLEVSSKNNGNLAANYKSEKTGYSKLNKADLEQLITQGLTEGWLTKGSILQAIKDNAK
jgi:hypothetical protein